MFTSRQGRFLEARRKKRRDCRNPNAQKTHPFQPVWVELDPKGRARAALWLALLPSSGSASVPRTLLLELKCNKSNQSFLPGRRTLPGSFSSEEWCFSFLSLHFLSRGKALLPSVAPLLSKGDVSLPFPFLPSSPLPFSILVPLPSYFFPSFSFVSFIFFLNKSFPLRCRIFNIFKLPIMPVALRYISPYPPPSFYLNPCDHSQPPPLCQSNIYALDLIKSCPRTSQACMVLLPASFSDPSSPWSLVPALSLSPSLINTEPNCRSETKRRAKNGRKSVLV